MRQPRFAFALPVLAAALAACSDSGVRRTGPVIEVDPLSIEFGTVITGDVAEARITVRNKGSVALVLQPPALVEQDGDGAVEMALAEALASDCDGAPRTGSGAERLSLFPGECGRVRLRYLPAAEGDDPATLTFTSNDTVTPTVVVPINAKGRAPDVEVCTLDDAGNESACNTAADPLALAFGGTGIGAPVTKKIRVKSVGSMPLTVKAVEIRTGDADFSVPTPPAADTVVESGAHFDVDVAFSALAGGPRKAVLEVVSNDPDERQVKIDLTGTGDAAKLCIEPLPAADFGAVNVGDTKKLTVKFSNCGTKSTNLKSLAFSDPIPPDNFSATLPTTPRAFAAGDFVNIEVTYQPNAIQADEGRLVAATDEERGWVVLRGEGVNAPGCRLDVNTRTLDFGQVAVLQYTDRVLMVSNAGDLACRITAMPTFVSGANVKFTMQGFPGTLASGPLTIQPGGQARFTLRYQPQDSQTPDQGQLKIPTDDPHAGDIMVSLTGTPAAEAKCQLQIVPSTGGFFGRTLAFGGVRVNSEKVLPALFKNVGSANCSIIQYGVKSGVPFGSGTSPFKEKPITVSPTITPGNSMIIEVGFTPVSETEYQGIEWKLEVVTSDKTYNECMSFSGFPPQPPPEGCVSFGLSGQGVRSDLEVLPHDLDFGLVTLGCRSQQKTLTLYNVGTAPIEIKKWWVEPVVNPAIFSIVGRPAPFTLAAGGQEKLQVTYKPPDANIHTATLFIESDATNVSTANPYTTVGLRGQGTTDSHQVDRFDQAARPMSDVLWVIDNSGSMGEEQGELSGNAHAFMQAAATQNTDYQVGVVTTDMDDASQAGKLQGSPKIIKPTTPASTAEQQFATTVDRLGTNGSGTERGLEAMWAALTDPLINDPNNNKGFLREEAKLAVIVVSDEEDSSRGANVDFYVDFLKNIKGIHNAHLVSFSAIVGDSPGAPGCSSSYGEADAGARYIEVQQRTGGKFKSICTQNWGTIAAELGLDAFGARIEFFLSRPCDPSTLTVRVNGQTVPRGTDYTYDASTNSIIFDPAYAPGPGAVIEADYNAMCL